MILHANMEMLQLKLEYLGVHLKFLIFKLLNCGMFRIKTLYQFVKDALSILSAVNKRNKELQNF